MYITVRTYGFFNEGRLLEGEPKRKMWNCEIFFLISSSILLLYGLKLYVILAMIPFGMSPSYDFDPI